MIDFYISVSFICLCINFLVAKDSPLEVIADILRDNLPKYVCKPLFDCFPCMASVWTTIAWLFTYPLSFKLIPAIFVVCGINVFILNIINR